MKRDLIITKNKVEICTSLTETRVEFHKRCWYVYIYKHMFAIAESVI